MSKANKIKVIFLIFSFFIVAILIGATLFLWNNETKDMESQESVSEQIAQEYLLSLTEREEIFNEENLESELPENTDLEYEDNEIFGSYTEETAVGTLDCVLEIPAIQLRQSIFTGTPDQIQRNLARWLSVTCRSDYVLGSTQYCIYMHNPTNKAIRISYAQDTLVPGDYITLTKGNTVFFYEMTRMFPEWRDVCTSDYADNMALDSSLMYIFTCARGQWQGRNLVIEGTLYNTYDLTDWQQNSSKYIAEYKGQYQAKETIDYGALKLDITNKEDKVQVSVTRPDEAQALHCSVGLFNEDGYLIGDDYPYEGYPLLLDLEPGEYIIGVYSNDTQYESPMPYQINFTKNADTTIQTIDKVEEDIESEGNIMKYIALSLSAVFCFMYGIVAVRTIKDIKQELKEKDDA